MSSVGEDRRIMNQDEQRTESLLFYSYTCTLTKDEKGVWVGPPLLFRLCVCRRTFIVGDFWIVHLHKIIFSTV